MIQENTFDRPALFIMPNFAREEESDALAFLSEAVEGVQSQTDQNWCLCIIDDNSSNVEVLSYLNKLVLEFPKKIKVIFLQENFGPGIARNFGLLIAKKHNSPFVLFNDSDDISHPERLEVTRAIFKENSEIGLVYSPFHIIDENNILRTVNEIPSSIMEIYELYQNGDLIEGEDVWIDMATRTGYLNKTSATSVLTSHILKSPFPSSRASEDYNVWMRLSAKGTHYKFVSSIPTRYRIPKYLNLQRSRAYLGNRNFNQTKLIFDEAAFEHSLDIALSRGKIDISDINMLKKKFYSRLIKSMQSEGEIELESCLKQKLDECTRISEIVQSI
jgi:glycosyltransferase involved in cell wall biosynthesis